MKKWFMSFLSVICFDDGYEVKGVFLDISKEGIIDKIKPTGSLIKPFFSEGIEKKELLLTANVHLRPILMLLFPYVLY